MSIMTHETPIRHVNSTITGLARRQNSPSGNPRFIVSVDSQGTPLRTADDIADAYGITAFTEGASRHGQSVALTLDHRGDILRVSERTVQT